MILLDKKHRVITNSFFLSAILYLTLVNRIHFPLNTLLKPLPILILLFAIRYLAISRERWTALLWALVFSVAGDIALTFDGKESFLAGLCFFAFAHLSYITLFFDKLKLTKFNALPIILLSVIAALLFAQIIPRAGQLQIPLACYGMLLITMVISAQLNQSLPGLTKLGSVLFMISDGLLAERLFVFPTLNLEPLIMTSYYLAQFFIVKGLLISALRHQKTD